MASDDIFGISVPPFEPQDLRNNLAEYLDTPFADAERHGQGGLRCVLLTQATRLQWLASQRYQALGAASVALETETEDADDI